MPHIQFKKNEDTQKMNSPNLPRSSELQSPNMTRAESSLLLLNALQCCDKCLKIVNQMELWAIEEYVSSLKGLRLSMKCALAFGSILDVHFGLSKVKTDSICCGSALNTAQNILNTGGETGILLINEEYMNLVKSFECVHFTKSNHTDLYSIKLSAETMSSALSTAAKISKVIGEILYFSEDYTELSKYSTHIHSYLPCEALKLFKDFNSKELYKYKWMNTSVIAFTMRNSAPEWEESENSTIAIELVKKVQECLGHVLKNAWPNEITYYQSQYHSDGVMTLLLTIGGPLESVNLFYF